MEGTGIIIIIHLQISMVLFYDFFNAFDSESMSAIVWFMGYRKSLWIIYRGILAGVDEYDNKKGWIFFLLYGELNKRVWNILCWFHCILQ